MPITEFRSGPAQPNRPSTPPSQVMEPPTSPAGAPAKSKGRHGRQNRASLMNSTRSPQDFPTQSETADFLVFPPFNASQIQMILWFSWTTTATPTQIANMHNQVFHDSRHSMSRWDVINIENDMATDWHESGGFFKGTEPMPLIVPPGDDNLWSCLCDFGVKNCWDYKRDQESGENLEKLTMARMLWDATPKQMVRCPHGRRKAKADARPPTAPPKPSMLQRLQALLSRPVTFVAFSPQNFMDVTQFVFTADFLCSIFVLTPEGQTKPLSAEYLFDTGMIGTVLLASPWMDIEVATTLLIAALVFAAIFNPEMPPLLLEGNQFLRDLLVRYIVAMPLYFLSPGIRPGAMTAMMVFLGVLWICLVSTAVLDIDWDMGYYLGLATLSFMVWFLGEVNWVKVWTVRREDFRLWFLQVVEGVRQDQRAWLDFSFN